MSKKLFSVFDEISSKQWKQKIQFDLKGADYNEALVWQSPEDIHVKPFYHTDDFEQPLNHSHKHTTPWNIGQHIYVRSVTQANTKALNIITRGAESILFTLPTEKISVYHLLKNIKLSNTVIYFNLEFLSEAFIIRLKNYLRNRNATVYVNVDIIGHLAETGNWFYNLKEDHNILGTFFNHSKNFKGVLSVNMSLYQNAGATMVQQLAYGLAHANEYLNHYDDSKALESYQMNFNIAVGTNYFFEIAKIRAVRKLWKIVAEEYNTSSECNIFVTPTKRNKTIYDYNTNMLRTTTECMSAILGGANTICNLPYDAIYHKDNEFGERIARNQLLVLKHESYFDKVNNASDGSYYIESLSEQLAEKALTIFKDIEAQGGFLKQLKEGTIQRKIKESAQKEQGRFNNEEDILLGTNKHPNANDKMKHDLELFPFVKKNKRKTIIEPIIPNRLSEQLEQERLKNEH